MLLNPEIGLEVSKVLQILEKCLTLTDFDLVSQNFEKNVQTGSKYFAQKVGNLEKNFNFYQLFLPNWPEK